jgi:hemoglobin-like flavoprotein
MDARKLQIFDDSLRRCTANPGFVDRFYELFLASSPKVREKFANTDFVRQRRALEASLHTLLLAATDGESGFDKHLRNLAATHSASNLNVGSELYDLWLDSLLQAVEDFDPDSNQDVIDAWEKVMGRGINYLLVHYHHPPEL